jgi:sRNA-binding carbon storage regulator CsrA
MMILTGSRDESIIVVLSDDSEIEITITELEGNRSKIVIFADEGVSVVRELYINSD